MSLAEVPSVLVLVGLIAYAVLAGADFGAGFWQLFSGSSPHGRRVKDHAHHAMGPVWEANHVWLIFVLVVTWTAYPEAFGSIMSTLAAPLFIAAIGIIMRGTAYALRSGTASAREQRTAETVLGVSSILTPFALGAAIGAIASGRVPLGNAEGDLVDSWLNPTSLATGTIAVATAAYLAAVFLAADAARARDDELVAAYRVRALGSGVVAGAIAIAGLFVIRDDAPDIWDGLTSGAGLACVLASGVAGVATLAFVYRGRFEPARYAGAIAVAAVIAGWGAAQRPYILPGLTVEDAAASDTVIWALLISCAIGAVLLVPSLILLFGLTLRGRFDEHAESGGADADVAQEPLGSAPQAMLVAAGICLVVGGGLMFFFENPWTSVLGWLLLLGFIAIGGIALARAATASGLRDAG
jgi:cytochrome bd ubiquinol oxidase subunit II